MLIVPILSVLDTVTGDSMGGISADDTNGVSKLESKLAKLEQTQETMKAVNTYYRKNKTLDGCPHLSTEQIEKLKEAMSGSWRSSPKPFESYLDHSQEKRHDFGYFLGRLVLPRPILVLNLYRSQISK